MNRNPPGAGSDDGEYGRCCRFHQANWRLHTGSTRSPGPSPSTRARPQGGARPRGCSSLSRASSAEHAALSLLSKTLIEKRGRLDDEDLDRFIAAGFSKDLALEVIAIVAASTITNYIGSVTKPPLEAPFQANAWSA